MIAPALMPSEDSESVQDDLTISYKIADYLNTAHEFSYIVYNFSNKQPLRGDRFH